MGSSQHLGDFEEIVLLAVARLLENAYGVTIRDAVEEATGREISSGAIYVTLDRLQAKKYVTSWIGEATKERGGRAKKYYKIEIAGQIALEESERIRRALRQGNPHPVSSWGTTFTGGLA